jgi:hypothetical protein
MLTAESLVGKVVSFIVEKTIGKLTALPRRILGQSAWSSHGP